MIQPYYDDGQITVYCNDALDVLPHLADRSVASIITDPPYAEATHLGARTGEVGDQRLIDFASTRAEDIGNLLAMATPLTRRWYVATMDWQHIGPLALAPPCGWRFVRFGVWVKPNGAPQFTGDRPGNGWEAVGIFHRTDERMRWNGGGRHAVWTFPKIEGFHPTGKPERLIREFVREFTDPGDLILDPFGGSLTTAVAAKSMGRRCIVIEREERYCAIGVRRLAQSVMELTPAQEARQASFQ